MKRLLFSAAFVAAVGLGTVAALSQQADPYANNAAAGAMKFPLAAKAGEDTHAIDKALPGAVNQGKFDDKTWKFGPAFNPPPGAKIWNPVKLKMMRGEKVTGGTVFAATDPSTYCAMANAGYDFIWTEHQHSPRDWEQTARMWATCPHAKAVPGVRVAYTDEREEQHALDSGALVLVVPTVRSYEEALKARDWAYFPPLGRRSSGGGLASSGEFWGGVPGGYRQTINDNLVLILMIETLAGLKDADQYRQFPVSPRSSPPRATSAITPAIARAIPTMSATSTSSTMRRSRPACGCAGRWPGATVRTSPASRRAAKPRPSPPV